MTQVTASVSKQPSAFVFRAEMTTMFLLASKESDSLTDWLAGWLTFDVLADVKLTPGYTT